MQLKTRWGMCGDDGEVCRGLAVDVWKEIQDAAEEAYDRSSACSFTSRICFSASSCWMAIRRRAAASFWSRITLGNRTSARPNRRTTSGVLASALRSSLLRRALIAAREDALIRSDRTAILVGELLDARALARWREVGP